MKNRVKCKSLLYAWVSGCLVVSTAYAEPDVANVPEIENAEKTIVVPAEERASANSLRAAKDGHAFAYFTNDKILIYSIDKAAKIQTIVAEAYEVAFSPDGNTIAAIVSHIGLVK